MSFGSQTINLLRIIAWFCGRHPWVTAIVVVALMLSATKAYDLFYPPTPQEIKVAQEQQKKDFEARQIVLQKQSEERQQKKYLCRLVSVCTHYASVRQECAVAGDFNRCVEIKLGDADSELTGSCAADGTVIGSQDKMPDTVDCFFSNLSGGQ